MDLGTLYFRYGAVVQRFFESSEGSPARAQELTTELFLSLLSRGELVISGDAHYARRWILRQAEQFLKSCETTTSDPPEGRVVRCHRHAWRVAERLLRSEEGASALVRLRSAGVSGGALSVVLSQPRSKLQHRYRSALRLLRHGDEPLNG